MKRFIFLLALGAAGALFIRHFVFEGIYLKTDSMAPTYPQGTHVFVNKFSFLFRSPRRGEVILFHTPQQPDVKKDLVKRVIAVERDQIQIRDKQIYLNGALLNEPYVQHLNPDEMYTTDNRPAVLVPKGCVVVLGDNRDVSGDSRDWLDADGDWSPYVCGKAIKGLVMGTSS
jgi:signal peptidase I